MHRNITRFPNLFHTLFGHSIVLKPHNNTANSASLVFYIAHSPLHPVGMHMYLVAPIEASANNLVHLVSTMILFLTNFHCQRARYQLTMSICLVYPLNQQNLPSQTRIIASCWHRQIRSEYPFEIFTCALNIEWVVDRRRSGIWVEIQAFSVDVKVSVR